MKKKKITLQEEIAELERELNMRTDKYPKWIERHKINRDVARHRWLCLNKTLNRLKKLSKETYGDQKSIL